METHINATSCRICHHPLKDIGSQIKGIGPICEKKHNPEKSDLHLHLNQEKMEKFLPRILDPVVAAPFRVQITRHYCKICGTDLDTEPIRHYEHDKGWIVPGFGEKQWLIITCPNLDCREDWALWKLGVEQP